MQVGMTLRTKIEKRFKDTALSDIFDLTELGKIIPA